jgi:hypothetical protein
MVAKCASVVGGRRCFLPAGAALLVHGALMSFADEFGHHLGRPCPLPRDLPVPKFTDFDEVTHRFRYDERYRLKRPDWTYPA